MISANQFSKAMAKADSVTQQNQAMEQVTADFADIINQILGEVPPPKNVEDVRYLTSKANAKLRLILAVNRFNG